MCTTAQGLASVEARLRSELPLFCWLNGACVPVLVPEPAQVWLPCRCIVHAATMAAVRLLHACLEVSYKYTCRHQHACSQFKKHPQPAAICCTCECNNNGVSILPGVLVPCRLPQATGLCPLCSMGTWACLGTAGSDATS